MMETTSVRLDVAPVFDGTDRTAEVNAALQQCVDAGWVSVCDASNKAGLQALTYGSHQVVNGVRFPVTVMSLFRVHQFTDHLRAVTDAFTAAGWVLERTAPEVKDPEAYLVYGPGLNVWVGAADARRSAEVAEAFALTARLGVGRVAPTSLGADVVLSMSEMRDMFDRWGVL